MALNCFSKKNKEKEDKEKQHDAAKQYETDVHKLPKDEIIKLYKTDFEKGITTEVYKEKMEEFGPNCLAPPKETHVLIKFLKSLLLDSFNVLLNVGGLLCLIPYFMDNEKLDSLYLAIVLIVVVLVTAIFSTYQEFSSNQTMKGFANFLPQSVNIMRDGVLTEVLAADIVPGDVVMLKAGDKVPADILVIKCSIDAKVDNSSLTGECEPQLRSSEMTNEEPMETKNICFFGTLLVQGNAEGMVFNTGDKTLMGQIALLSSETKSEETPIGKEISHFVKLISGIAILLGIVLGITDFVLNKDWQNTLVFFIGIIVANVPEGLLVTLTVCLSLAAKQMSKKSVLVKNLEGVETLGSTSAICSDKTGTLTINKMTVSHIFYDEKQRPVDTHNPKEGEFSEEDSSFKRLVRCATLCNNAKFNDNNVIVGDASESALIKFSSAHIGKPLNEYRNMNKSVHSIPFNSKNKWQLSIHEIAMESETKNVLVMKGAPERVLRFCTNIRAANGEELLTEEHRETIKNGITSFAKQGERVLAFCELELDTASYPVGFEFEGELPEKSNFPFKKSEEEQGFTFLGLASMIDPPRPGVPQSVLKCQSAGIRVFMVTGDHPATARAIATKVNIINKDDTVYDFNEIEQEGNLNLESLEASIADACVVTGAHINTFNEDTSEADVIRFWNGVLKHNHVVFSRTSPQHKLLIVEACQKRNSIVAVTGDGVNDSPALKKADIGIAMGITGTDVAKEAADMILLDDNFSSIVSGVEEGRILFDNLKKSIAYTLSSNIPEIFPFIVNVFFGFPLPLQTVQIFAIDLLTDMTPAISMAYEKKEADIMKREPRNPKTDRLVTKVLVGFSYLMIGIIQLMAGFFTYACVFYYNDFSFGMIYGLDKQGSKFGKCSSDEILYLTCASILADSLDTDKKHLCAYKSNTNTLPDDKYPIKNMNCADRKKLLGEANAAYVISIVVVQIADVMISKTRANSVFTQGMGNWLMNFGIVLEVFLISCLVYIKPLANFLGFSSVNVLFWTLPLPYFVIIFVFDELRKFLIRRDFKGWVKRNTYW